MPPLQALVALHGLWALALFAVVLWAVWKWPTVCLVLVGCAVATLGAAGLAVVIGTELLTWYPAVPPSQQQYIGQRILYALGTNTDLPAVQLSLAGIALWLAARRRKRSVPLPQAEGFPTADLANEAGTGGSLPKPP
jgi:hypothetical protein